MQVLPGLQLVIVPLLAEHHVLPHLRVNPAGPQACSLKRDFYSQKSRDVTEGRRGVAAHLTPPVCILPPFLFCLCFMTLVYTGNMV